MTLWREQLEHDGYFVLANVFDAGLVAELVGTMKEVLRGEAAITGEGGAVYAARNLLALWPGTATFWRRPPLPEALADALGSSFGLVRALYFDKPPGQTWSLPWHKDLTIAVRDNRLPSPRFRRPTAKAGVPHVEAPPEVLQSMLTARIHLDDVTEENGPLKVAPGSHHAGKSLAFGDGPPRTVLVRRGDVLLMRPLVAHCSGKSHADTTRHRRILHLEFAASPSLPDGYAWHDFIPGSE